MKISEEIFLRLEKGDTIVLCNRIYDVFNNDTSKNILLLVRHAIVRDIDALPADLQKDFLVTYNYEKQKNKKVKVLEKQSKVESFLNTEPKPPFLRARLYGEFEVYDSVVLKKDFINTTTSLTAKTFDMDEYALCFQGRVVEISNVIYSQKLGLFIYRFKEDSEQRDWFNDIIEDIDDLPF